MSSDKIHSLQCDAYKLIEKNLSVMIEITSPLVKACGSPVDLNLKRFQDSSTARLLSWNFAFYANEAQSIIHKCVIPGSECRLSVLQRERDPELLRLNTSHEESRACGWEHADPGDLQRSSAPSLKGRGVSPLSLSLPPPG